ncbi:hypothetical protein D3C86_1863380 [compost metagenome]
MRMNVWSWVIWVAVRLPKALLPSRSSQESSLRIWARWRRALAIADPRRKYRKSCRSRARAFRSLKASTSAVRGASRMIAVSPK